MMLGGDWKNGKGDFFDVGVALLVAAWFVGVHLVADCGDDGMERREQREEKIGKLAEVLP
jgi:hypothetical protein